ncbi:hypothetical protein BCR36DRAFT_415457 [Piromyces finnis]|uniref:Uncharacterized protein n=1 Tax=Piromyces finnis TaxID=1754191 RepID=A0A1Y1UYL3_9FUNG|nr:hypothetical protein BCR36DRAFT_415457 [Piromyces finnis]|eukprot:ORX43605.1 hypothetical protein BCR36DRAFT_415457 [Piromyces finnis]
MTEKVNKEAKNNTSKEKEYMKGEKISINNTSKKMTKEKVMKNYNSKETRKDNSREKEIIEDDNVNKKNRVNTEEHNKTKIKNKSNIYNNPKINKNKNTDIDIKENNNKEKEKRNRNEKVSNNDEIVKGATITNKSENGKRSFRKDAKNISKRLVNLFYTECKVDSWQMSTDFNHKFDSRALSFISYHFNKLKISRKNYIIILLLTLSKKRISELNKNAEFRKFLDKIENESKNPKMGLDKCLISTVLFILYNKMISIQKNNEIEERLKNYKPIPYNISKFKNAVLKYKCNSPLYTYINHKKEDEIRIPNKIKWKSNQVIPSKMERMNNYKKLNYFKNIDKNLDEFMKPKSIFEPVLMKEIITKDTPSFLRSRNNFAGVDTFVNKSISIPRIEKSMLTTNRDKKLVMLEHQEIKKLEREEKMRLQELKEEEKKKKKLKRKKGNSQSKSSKRSKRGRKKKQDSENPENDENNKTDYETDYCETDNYETDYYETDNYETDKEPTTPKSNRSAPSSPEITIHDSDNDGDENTNNDIVSSPLSVINSPGSPLMPITLSPTSDIDLVTPSPTQFSIIDSYSQNSNYEQQLNKYSSSSTSNIKIPDYLKNVKMIENPSINISPLNPNEYLFEKKSNIDSLFNSNWLVKESNKIIKKYLNTESLDNENIMDENKDDYEGYNNNIYLRIHNFNKKSIEEQKKTPLNFKYNYFPSKEEKYPNPINNIINLSIGELELLNKYKNIDI